MLRTIAVSLAAIAAASAAPVLAQDTNGEGPFFDGVYVSGGVALDAIGSDNKRVVFDTQRNGAFGNQVLTTTGANAFSPGFCNGTAIGNAPGRGCVGDQESYGYFVRAGLDQRVGNNFVAGVLVEASKSDSTDFTTAFSTTPASYSFSRSLDYAFSGRGRLGFSPGDGRGLMYVTGGVSYADLDRGFSTTNGANSFTLVGDDDMVWGGQIGGGAELMLSNNIGIGLDYLYSKYDDDDGNYVEVGRGTAPATNPFLLVSGGTFFRPAKTDYSLHSFRATASFHF